MTDQTSSPEEKVYTSPQRKLVKFFEKSRDTWKARCLKGQATIHRLKNRATWLEQSRNTWKARARQRAARIRELEAQTGQSASGHTKKKTAYAVAPPQNRTLFLQTPRHHHYSVGVMLLFVTFVLSSVTSLRGAARAIEIVTAQIPLPVPLPPCSWATGRLWLLRLGLYKLTRPKTVADDWVWILDHSVQIGQEKCLLILGIRLSTLQNTSCRLTHADLEPLDLRPVKKSTGDVVYQQLENAVKHTGVPREILSDHGPDLQSGIHQFCQAHPTTCAVYDITHKAAALVKAFLTYDDTWDDFCRFATTMKQQVQQTELAPLAPPAQKSKARYMNVERLGTWAGHLLDVLDEGSAVIGTTTISDHADRGKADWVERFRDDIEVWAAVFGIVEMVEQSVRQHGLQQACVDEVEARLHAMNTYPHVADFGENLLSFIRTESAKAHPGERLLGSSEVIESVFGKLKHIEGAQAKQGFTGLILSAAAMVGSTSAAVVQQAMETISVKAVYRWCREMLGVSVQAQRQMLFAQAQQSGTKPG